MTTPKPSNETRIRELELELRSIRAQLKQIAGLRANNSPGVRVVRAVDNADSGAGEQTVKTVFVKTQHAGSFNGVAHAAGAVTLTDRDSAQQSLAAWFVGNDSLTVPKDCRWPAFRSDDGQWWLFPLTSMIGRVVSDAGIPAATINGGGDELTPGEGEVEIWFRDGSVSGRPLKDTGARVTAGNMVQSVVGKATNADDEAKPKFVQLKVDIYGDVWVDVEDCG